MKNICIAFEKWIDATPLDIVIVKLVAIGAVAYIMWLLFSCAHKELEPKQTPPIRKSDGDNFNIRTDIKRIEYFDEYIEHAFVAGFNCGQLEEKIPLTSRADTIKKWFIKWKEQMGI
jgi:hypothetical protein